MNGEGYSKEAYKDAESEEAAATKKHNEFVRKNEREGRPALSKDEQSIFDRLTTKSVEAVMKIEELYGKGRAEAIALNEEYNRLMTRAQEATKAVEDFEKEKLGM